MYVEECRTSDEGRVGCNASLVEGGGGSDEVVDTKDASLVWRFVGMALKALGPTLINGMRTRKRFCEC